MLIDNVKIYVKAGNGGNGCVAFHREKYVARGGPSGGDGGRGGNIVLTVDEGANTLLAYKYRHKFVAKNGGDGMSEKFHGASAEDLILPVPPGTVVRDAQSEQLIVDMSATNEFILCKGGRGGWGNKHFATPTRQIPRFAKSGTLGEEKEVILELKMIADVGLIGFPNVGKSSILSQISAARPKIADYHFTTLSPNLGVVNIGDEGKGFVAADIPGLIEGASDGVGLGHAFLRHVDRCRLLVHVDSFDEYYSLDTRYAFSTKIADYCASGVPVFLYSPEECESTQYLKKYNAAFTADTKENLQIKLEMALYNKHERNNKVYNASKVVSLNHKKEMNDQKFMDVVMKCME